MRRNQSGQAILEYLLLVLMIAITMAAVIRSSNRTLYRYWTGLVRQVASPCVDCVTPDGPDLEGGDDRTNVKAATPN
jgi:Flp pilus assembly pilin Flp